MTTLLMALSMLLCTIAAAAVVMALVRTLRGSPSTKVRWSATLVHALVCLFALQVFNAWPGYFVANQEVYGVLNEWPFNAVTRSHELRPFVLIDNSGNKMLVPDSTGNAEDSTVLVLTDRAKLARLLTRLAQHPDAFAQVVCDITFEEASPHDAQLRDAIRELAVHKKILLAQGNDPNTSALQFNEGVMAAVTEEEQQGLIAWHTLMRNDAPTLPYALYRRLHQRTTTPLFAGLLWETGPSGGMPVFGGFVPTWAYLPAAQTVQPGEDDVPVPAAPVMPLGHALDLGWDRLLHHLNAPGSVIFIGEFPGEGTARNITDTHRTFSGAYQGGHLLIDLFHELEQGAHRLRFFNLLTQYLLLLGCSALAFRRVWDVPMQEPTKNGATWALIRAVLWKGVKDAFPLMLLLFSAFLLRVLFGQYVNMGALFIYFLALIGLLGQLRKTYQGPSAFVPANATKP